MTERVRFGVEGLDDVLEGGLTRDRVYLIEGSPGTGKTTLALQFLMEGARRGEIGLYITLSETAYELRASAASHGWSLDGIELYELVPPETLLDAEQQQSLLYSSDLELGETTKSIIDQVERLKPSRIVLDSLSEIRLLAQGSLRYRRQILALKHYFANHSATVVLLDDLTGDLQDRSVHSLSHGVIRLEELAPEYGSQRRRMRVVKYRGAEYRGGFHDFSILRGGIRVYPRLVAAEHRRGFSRQVVSSGSEGFDHLLGGGLERGTGTLLIGPAGTGKTLLALQCLISAMSKGMKAAAFIFDEDLGLLLDRAANLGLDLDGFIKDGRLHIESVDAAEMSPGQFIHKVRQCVEERDAAAVLIDSLNGYQAAMPQEAFLLLHLHELLSFLNRRGALTLTTVAQHGLIGDTQSPVDVTYLSDTVILLRYFEAAGRIRRAVSVMKKRASSHENTIREMRITQSGVEFGAPLEQFQGILRGVPSFIGGDGELIGAGGA